MDSILSVKNLTKTYENFKLDNVSFDLPKGCIMGFIGENGAGKSTTIKSILNLIEIDGGSISILGTDNLSANKKLKESIGVVFDENCFPENLTTKEINKIMKNIYTQWEENTFNNFMKKFNLPGNKRIKDFSRGMKVKLSLAAAMSHNAKLLILDEATSGLDPIARDEILDLFLDFIQDENHSILLSSHITTDLSKIADYITFIHKGKIIFSKSKDELDSNLGIVRCGAHDFDNLDKTHVIRYKKNHYNYEVLIDNRLDFARKNQNIVVEKCSIDDIMLFYVRGEK